jgi:ABC-type phosphate/phosphonate transport system substrate-binding protein
MYDWPEIQDATDAFWAALHKSLLNAGFSPPAQLSRHENPFKLWQDPGLLIGQTCGLPYMEKLSSQVSLVGTPAYDIDCGAGSYFSVIISHSESGIVSLSDKADVTFGYNDPLSQSGVAAFFAHLREQGISLKSIRSGQHLGSHRRVIQQVAEGRIDIASIDAVTWELAKRHEKAAKKITVIGQTRPTPGLPFITARRPKSEVDRLHQAVIDAMASLSSEVQDALLLTGFAATEEADYHSIKWNYDQIRPEIDKIL